MKRFLVILLLMAVVALDSTEVFVEEVTPSVSDISKYPASIETAMAYFKECAEIIIRKCIG